MSDERILFCGCEGRDLLPEPAKRRVRDHLRAAGLDVMYVPDLCRLAAEKAPVLSALAAARLTVVACYPRAVQWLFHAGGAPLDSGRVTCLNLREQSADDIVAALPAGPRADGPVPRTETLPSADDWNPWFPVIDYDRCVRCGQCMDFCLFSVYDRLPDGSITVANPRSCKTNCPACARICPHVAIVFPKYADRPINGAPVADAAPGQAPVRLDFDQALGDDVYAALAARRQRARDRLLDRDRLRQALDERAACGGECGNACERER